MAISVKRVARFVNPMKPDSEKKVYGMITYKYVTPITLKEIARKLGASGSSASEGEAMSIMKDFRTHLYNGLVEGRPVNIDGLGYFYLAAQSEGVDKPEDFTMKNITGLRICFRANNDIRINTGRAGSTRSLGLVFKDVDRINGTVKDNIADEGNDSELPDGGEDNGEGEAPDPLS